MPCLVVGSGGHSIENLFEACDGSKAPRQDPPFPAVTSADFAFPTGDSAQLEAYRDKKKTGSMALSKQK